MTARGASATIDKSHWAQTLRTCGVADCERPYKENGLCAAHAYRLRSSGSVGWDRPILEHGLVDRVGQCLLVGDGCWEWTGSRRPDGYGQIHVGGKNRRAHRVVYELMVGPIPEGLTIDHLCRNRACCRPDHLEPVTRAENTRRGGAALTHCKRAGHLYDEQNTYVSPKGERRCRACAAERGRNRLADR